MVYLGREGCAAPFARRFQELVSNHVDLGFMDKLVLGGEGGTPSMREGHVREGVSV